MKMFKPGEVVSRKDGEPFSNGEMALTILKMDGDVAFFKESHVWLRQENLKYAYPNPPHRHRDLIIAWANGAEIEHASACYGQWMPVKDPTWGGRYYRIKPSKPPQGIEIEIASIQVEMDKLKQRLEELKHG